MTYDDAYRALDLAAIDYDEGVHPKHRLTHYHDFFVERVNPGETVLDIGTGKESSRTTSSHAEARASSASTTIRVTWRTPGPTSSTSDSSSRDGDVIEGIPPGHFDVVVLSNVLEHLGPRVELLARVVESATPRCVLLRVPLYERDWTAAAEGGGRSLSVLGPGPRDRVRRAALPRGARSGWTSTSGAGAAMGRDLGTGGAAMSDVVGSSGSLRTGGRAWSRLLTSGRPDQAYASSTVTTRSPAPGARRGGHREVPTAGNTVPEPSDRLLAPLPRLDVAAARSSRAALARAAALGSRSCSTRTASATPGWAGSDAETFNRPLRTVLGAAEHVLYQSEFCKRARTSSWPSLPGRGGPAQRGRHPALHSGGAASGGRARRSSRGRPVPGLPARARARDARARSCRRIPARSSSSPGGS